MVMRIECFICRSVILGWVVTMLVMDIVFQWSFHEGVCVKWWCLFWWMLFSGVLTRYCGYGCFYGVYFWVFRLYTAPFVCIIWIIGLCSSYAEIWFLIKFVVSKKKKTRRQLNYIFIQNLKELEIIGRILKDIEEV